MTIGTQRTTLANNRIDSCGRRRWGGTEHGSSVIAIEHFCSLGFADGSRRSELVALVVGDRFVREEASNEAIVRRSKPTRSVWVT
jgi:hypothetical protein